VKSVIEAAEAFAEWDGEVKENPTGWTQKKEEAQARRIGTKIIRFMCTLILW
jgi:hypothetical protein